MPTENTTTTIDLTAYLRKAIKQDHQKWIAANPHATLGDLAEHIERALDECESWGDELISDHLHKLGDDLAHELDQWEDDGNELFEYRAANLEEYQIELAELIETVGKDFPVRNLSRSGRIASVTGSIGATSQYFVATRGRPPTYTDGLKTYIVHLIACHGLTGARKILNADECSQILSIRALASKRNLSLVPHALGISMPTLGKLAKEAGIKLHRGRPSK